MQDVIIQKRLYTIVSQVPDAIQEECKLSESQLKIPSRVTDTESVA